MKARNKVEITVETHRILTIKKGSRHRLAWCEGCGEPVRMVTADEAAILARVSPREIYQQIEAQEIHFVETPDRLIFLCLNSLGNLS